MHTVFNQKVLQYAFKIVCKLLQSKSAHIFTVSIVGDKKFFCLGRELSTSSVFAAGGGKKKPKAE